MEIPSLFKLGLPNGFGRGVIRLLIYKASKSEVHKLSQFMVPLVVTVIIFIAATVQKKYLVVPFIK
jgi:hypothetical protein